MRAFVSTLAAAALAASAVIAMQLPAAAANNIRPRVQPGDCGQLSARLGRSKVWQASFSASSAGDNFDPPDFINVAPCFASYSDCFNWLYWAQTDWPPPAQSNVGFCKRGMPYS